MNADDVLKIIQAIPEYIIYLYPGYLTVYIYFFLRGKILKDSNFILLKSIAISYVYLVVLDGIRNVKFLKNVFNYLFSSLPFSLKQNLYLIAISIVIPYIAYRLVLSGRILKMMAFFKINTTFYDNEIEMLADFNKGAWLCVYLRDDNIVYEGALGYKEMEEDKRKYICLHAYYKYFLRKDGKPKEPYIEDNGDNQDEVVMIFYDDIKRIEKRATGQEEE